MTFFRKKKPEEEEEEWEEEKMKKRKKKKKTVMHLHFGERMSDHLIFQVLRAVSRLQRNALYNPDLFFLKSLLDVIRRITFTVNEIKCMRTLHFSRS